MHDTDLGPFADEVRWTHDGFVAAFAVYDPKVEQRWNVGRAISSGLLWAYIFVVVLWNGPVGLLPMIAMLVGAMVVSQMAAMVGKRRARWHTEVRFEALELTVDGRSIPWHELLAFDVVEGALWRVHLQTTRGFVDLTVGEERKARWLGERLEQRIQAFAAAGDREDVPEPMRRLAAREATSR